MSSRRRLRRVGAAAALFLLPGALALGFSFYVPGGWNLILSFQKWNGFAAPEWIGWQNYWKVLGDATFQRSVSNTAWIAVGITVLSVLIGLTLALMVYRMGRREGAFYRLVLFMPSMIPVSIIGLLFTFVYNSDMGLVNNLLRACGLDTITQAWLEGSGTVLPSIVAVGVWRMAGMPMMLCFVALQSIPESLLEAGRLDGASFSEQVRRILLPLIRPTIQLSSVFVILNSFKTYDLVYVLTRGGPGTSSMTVPIYMEKVAFQYGRYGQAASMGSLMALVELALVCAVYAATRGDSYEF